MVWFVGRFLVVGCTMELFVLVGGGVGGSRGLPLSEPLNGSSGRPRRSMGISARPSRSMGFPSSERVVKELSFGPAFALSPVVEKYKKYRNLNLIFQMKCNN